MRPFTGRKLFAVKYFPGGYGSLGGIKINWKTEVVREDFTVIPGLYAAGTDACSIFGDSYVFILPGNTMGFALNSGRMAGEHAVELSTRPVRRRGRMNLPECACRSGMVLTGKQTQS